MERTELNVMPQTAWLLVPAQDITRLLRIAHRFRQEIGDPRLPGYARRNYADTIEAVDTLADNAKPKE